MPDPIMIRLETSGDLPAIHRLNELAFGQTTEADLVDALRQVCPVLLSLVAEHDGQVIGHALFSPVIIEGSETTLNGMGLGPIAVLPQRQRQGIGAQLIQAGIRQLRGSGCPFIIVLGHPAYYPRFGFVPASSYSVRCEWEVPDEAFMLLVLDQSLPLPIPGVAHYHPEFNRAV